MAKILAVLDGNGNKIAEVTQSEARKMHKAEQIKYLDDRRAVQLIGSTGERILTGITRGLSARPDDKLIDRYHRDNELVDAAVDIGWRESWKPVETTPAQQ